MHESVPLGRIASVEATGLFPKLGENIIIKSTNDRNLMEFTYKILQKARKMGYSQQILYMEKREKRVQTDTYHVNSNIDYYSCTFS